MGSPRRVGRRPSITGRPARLQAGRWTSGTSAQPHELLMRSGGGARPRPDRAELPAPLRHFRYRVIATLGLGFRSHDRGTELDCSSRAEGLLDRKGIVVLPFRGRSNPGVPGRRMRKRTRSDRGRSEDPVQQAVWTMGLPSLDAALRLSLIEWRPRTPLTCGRARAARRATAEFRAVCGMDLWDGPADEPVRGGVEERERPRFRGLSAKRMKGLEPSTFCMASRRSSQLSYIRGVRCIIDMRDQARRPAGRRLSTAALLEPSSRPQRYPADGRCR